MSKLLTSVLALLTAASAALAAGPVQVIEDFENGLGPGWEEKKFQGRTQYTVVREDGNQVLRAESRNSASGLVRRISYDLAEFPLLSWRWKIDMVLTKGDATRKEGDDYAARVYVIFPHWFPPKTRSLNYIWANRLPVNSHVPNAFYSRAVLIAVQSGPEKAGQWVEQSRNVLADFRQVFGEEPPKVGALALMTDTDQTGETAVAWYDDLQIAAPSSAAATRLRPSSLAR